ncbi:MAG: flagellar basal body rod protein FlgC [Phycisphaerales bacterium]|nr:flagellar basal body rod protein FlgC [Phycisphaerales bacterium]
MYGALDISTSGLIAQRTRLEAITSNIANANTFLDEAGRNNPYQRRVVFFAPSGSGSAGLSGGKVAAQGVKVATIEQEDSFDLRYEPGNPYADSSGYIKVPAINTVFEQLNAFQAQRSYEANIAAAEATKTMMAQALRLIA